jgi:5-methylcytosine-specific restriction endonuclease McrA
MALVVPDLGAPTIDHIVPMAKGGDDTKINVQLAHFSCNSRKGHRA